MLSSAWPTVAQLEVFFSSDYLRLLCMFYANRDESKYKGMQVQDLNISYRSKSLCEFRDFHWTSP